MSLKQSINLEWRPVKDFEGYYEVSNTGLVRSVDREIKHSRGSGTFTKKGKVLKPASDKNGYLLISLSRNSKQIKVRIHRLVAQAFIENVNNLPLVNHKDGVKSNNSIINLEWCDHSQNAIHAKDLGLTKIIGEENPSSKLSKQDVLNIRHMYFMGYKSRHLQYLYDISSATVWDICNFRTWRHI